MARFCFAILAAILASANAFTSQSSAAPRTDLKAAPEGAWDPMSFATLGDGEAFDTFPNMFPKYQFLKEAEIKHGRQAMLAWTGIWATHQGGMGLGLHFPGCPDEPDWTKALGVFAAEQPGVFGCILAFIAIAEGESVGHAGDNWRGVSTKTPGDFGFDLLGLKSKLSEEEFERYKQVEMVQGRAAMLGMASMFAFESIPGSVPLMTLFGAS